MYALSPYLMTTKSLFMTLHWRRLGVYLFQRKRRHKVFLFFFFWVYCYSVDIGSTRHDIMKVLAMFHLYTSFSFWILNPHDISMLFCMYRGSLPAIHSTTGSGFARIEK